MFSASIVAFEQINAGWAETVNFEGKFRKSKSGALTLSLKLIYNCLLRRTDQQI